MDRPPRIVKSKMAGGRHDARLRSAPRTKWMRVGNRFSSDMIFWICRNPHLLWGRCVSPAFPHKSRWGTARPSQRQLSSGFLQSRYFHSVCLDPGFVHAQFYMAIIFPSLRIKVRARGPVSGIVKRDLASLQCMRVRKDNFMALWGLSSILNVGAPRLPSRTFLPEVRLPWRG